MVNETTDIMKKVNQQSGQVILVLILVMMVALTIGLAVSQRSVSNVANSTSTEQSTRAYAAAEAGIERALLTGAAQDITADQLGNDAHATVTGSGELPQQNGQADEIPAINKADFAQFWLASPTDLTPFYTQSDVDIYFGNGTSADANERGYDVANTPAIEVNLITRNGAGVYISTRRYFDANAGRRASNNFEAANCLTSGTFHLINTDLSPNRTNSNRSFQCQVTGFNVASAGTPILLRVRLLYSSVEQRVAVEPNGGNLPPQKEIFTSVGFAGQTQRRLQAIRTRNVVPHFLDYAIFSQGDLTK